VEIGSIVTVESGGKRMTFEILGSLETDPLHGRISYQSPIGTALVNRIVGETVTIETKQGPVVYRIVEVR